MLRTLMVRGVRKLTLTLAAQRSFYGVDVRLFVLGVADRDIAWDKVGHGLRLLQQYDPRAFARLRELVDIVLVEEKFGALHAQWLREDRLISFDHAFIRAADTGPFQIAATLAHEVAHAWLESVGFEYRPERRARIEAICYRSMAAFMRRVPNASEWADYYERLAAWALSVGAEGWSDRAYRERQLGAHKAFEEIMRKDGTSEFTLRAIRRLVGRGSA